MLNEYEQKLLTAYIARFNAKDFDGVREMLADEVRLDLVNKTKMRGKSEVADNYFHNYRRIEDWRLKLGTVENRLAILVLTRKKTRRVQLILCCSNGTATSECRKSAITVTLVTSRKPPKSPLCKKTIDLSSSAYSSTDEQSCYHLANRR